LVDFPQSDSGQHKRCPALIILDIGDADVVLAPITTKEQSGHGDYKLRDWQAGGLLRESWVRVAKIACLKKSDITRRLGRLTDHDKDIVSKLWQKVYAFSSETQVRQTEEEI
jgi:mRNA-degrading endonuclease toxin of MazEF toxin-antitoxin module